MSTNTQTSHAFESAPLDAANHISNSVLAGMQPAFQHAITGELHLAQLEKGIVSANYTFVGLPDSWIVDRDDSGRPTALHADVIAGYWRLGRFIALSQLGCLPLDG